jgi:hypothetical protein
LLRCQGAKGCEHSAVDTLCIVYQRAYDLLNECFLRFVEEGGSVVILRILYLCAVGWFYMWVQLVLGLFWCCVLKLSECLRHLFKHGDVYFFVVVVPVDVHSQVALPVPILQALVMFIEDGGEVFGLLATNVFDAKIVDA